MIAGRFRWKEPGAAITGKIGLAAFDFSNGTLLLTEASPKKRAAIHLRQGEEALAEFNRGGLEPLDANLDQFRSRLLVGNHTLKRALTDPHLFSGIGNAYSDEILFEAKLSPFVLTQKITDEQINTLFDAVRTCLTNWLDRLRNESGGVFPEKVTAFRPEMAVHGRYKQPCSRCGSKIQRIRYASNESNYCPECQTGGKLLADRALSRLLRDDWPKTPEQLENRIASKTRSSGQ